MRIETTFFTAWEEFSPTMDDVSELPALYV